MSSTNARPSLLIAVPRLLCFKTIFNKTIELVLPTLGDIDVSLVPDRAGEATRLLEAKGISPKLVRISTRLDAKIALKQYSHVLIFWDGDDCTDIVYFARLFNKHVRIVPVQVTKVKNKDKLEEFDVYIGRGTLWGNPYPIEHETNGSKREAVIEKFKTYFLEEIVKDPEKLKLLLALKGLRLGCHCKPLSCHGDVIADFLNAYEDGGEQPE
jgi:hypothetical protein